MDNMLVMDYFLLLWTICLQHTICLLIMAPVTFMCYICLLRATSLLYSLCVRNGSCDFHGFHDLYMFAVTKKGIVLSAFKQLQQKPLLVLSADSEMRAKTHGVKTRF